MTPLPISTWTLEETSYFTNALHKELQPHYCVGLTGRVLYDGHSRHDLDVIVFPSKSQRWDLTELYVLLVQAGLVQLRTREQVQKYWAKRYHSEDKKHVEIWQTSDAKRVDLFFLR